MPRSISSGTTSSASRLPLTEFTSLPSIAWVSKVRRVRPEFWASVCLLTPLALGHLPEVAHAGEQTLIVDQICVTGEIRCNWPFLRDRRTDAYAPILNRQIDLIQRLPSAARGSACPRGAARSHLDLLPSQPRGLARPLHSHSVGLRRDRAQAEFAEKAAFPGHPRRNVRRCWCRSAGGRLIAVEFFECPHRSHGRALRPQFFLVVAASSVPPSGASTDGRSTTTKPRRCRRHRCPALALNLSSKWC